jgi:hypothetical protein
MDSLKFHPGLPCLTLLCPAGGPLPKWPYSHLWGGSPAGQAACSHHLPPWTHHTVWGFPTVYCSHSSVHGHKARSIHGLPKVLLGPAMPYPSTPSGKANSKTALQPFQEWSALKAGSLQSLFNPIGHPTPYAFAFVSKSD